jgi:type I restriction enzyme, S subunit
MNNTYTITNPALNPKRVFILQKSEVENRYDPQFYINRVKIKNSVKLSTIVKIKGGKRIPKGKYYAESPTDFQYLRVSDMKDFGLIDWNGLRYIPEDVYYFLERYKVEKEDVIISIAGTVGKTALIEKDIKNTILTENCAILEIRDKSKLLPKYLHILLELSTSKRQIELGYIQTTIPKLGFDKIEQLQLPAIPSIDRQNEIINLYNKSISQKQTNEAEAEKLLASIDDYLLGKLGITLPTPPENTLKNRMFTKTYKEISDGRIDPHFHQEKFKQLDIELSKGKFPLSKLKKKSILITSGATPLSKGDSYTEDETIGVPFVRSGEIKDITFEDCIYIKPEIHNTMLKSSQLKKDDLLIAIVGATIGEVGIYNHDREANINQAIALVRLGDELLPIFAKDFYKSAIGAFILDRAKRPVARANINLDEIGILPIPVPPLDKQKEIAEHITNIRNQAQALKDKTKDLLKKASEEIEEILLN